jgi:hypothetical protein
MMAKVCVPGADWFWIVKFSVVRKAQTLNQVQGQAVGLTDALLHVKPRGDWRFAYQSDDRNALGAFAHFESALCLQLVACVYQFSFRLFGAVEQRDFGFGTVKFHCLAVVGDMDLNAVWLGYDFHITRFGFYDYTAKFWGVIVLTGSDCTNASGSHQ